MASVVGGGGGTPSQVPPIGQNPPLVAPAGAAAAGAAGKVAAPIAYGLVKQSLDYDVRTGQIVLQIDAKDQTGKAITIKKTMNVSVDGAEVRGSVAAAMVAKFKEAQNGERLALEFLQNEADNANRKVTVPPSQRTMLAIDFDDQGFTVERMKAKEVVGSRRVQFGALLGVNQQKLQELQNKHKEGIAIVTTHVQSKTKVDDLFKNTRASDVFKALDRIFGDKDVLTIGDLAQVDRHGLNEHQKLADLLDAPENIGLTQALRQKWMQAQAEVQKEKKMGSLVTRFKNRSKEKFDITKPSISNNSLIKIITDFAKTPVKPLVDLALEEEEPPPPP